MDENRNPAVRHGGGLVSDVPSGAIGTELASQTPNQPASKSWRDVLKVHPACELFPRMSDDELKVLGEDIQENGLQHPVVLWSPGDEEGDEETLLSEIFLLDGRNRLDAMELVGIQTVENGELSIDDLHNPSFNQLKHLFEFRCAVDDDLKDIRLPDTDPYAYVVSVNIKRRHLTAKKKAELIAALIKLDPTKSNRGVAKQTGVSPTTVGKVRDELEAKGDVSTVDTRTDSMGRNQPARRQAKPARPPGITTAPKPVPEAPQPEAKPVSRAPMFDDGVQQPAPEPRSAGNGVDPAASAEARKAQVADAETDVAAEATTPVQPLATPEQMAADDELPLPAPPDLATVPESAEPKLRPPSKEARWLWDWLGEFERNGLLAKQPAEILATMPPWMLDHVHTLAPRVAAWLKQIEGLS
jgi:hypothetical protein